jgi:hypothetical protein
MESAPQERVDGQISIPSISAIIYPFSKNNNVALAKVKMNNGSRHSSVSIVTTLPYGLLGNRGSIAGRNDIFFFFPKNVRPDSEIHPASYSMGTGDSFSRDKTAGV